MEWENLADGQKKKVVISQMSLKENCEDGMFVKLEAGLVADGRTQDRSLYQYFLSPTARTRSVITCLKIAAMKGWGHLKVNIGGAFLCAKIDESEEVFLQLDKKMHEMAFHYMSELREFLR
jgi:hypothetical protein